MKKGKTLGLKNFMGQFVEIVTTVNISAVGETDAGMFEKTHPMLISGYLLGADEQFVYLGETPSDLTDAVSITKVVQVGVSKPFDKYEKLLDDAEEPQEYH